MLNKKTVDDINVKGKKVLVRCDFNVPLQDGKITDENRLVAALPTIKKLIADGGRIILCSHLGKPKGEPKPELSLAPVAVRLSELLGQEVKFAADPEVVGPNAKAAVEAMNDGDVILLENTRYRAEETKNGDEFSKELASLCDVFVNDAFGTAHRAHCSNVGVTKYVDTAVVGYLMEKEIAFLGNAVNNPERPFVAIIFFNVWKNIGYGSVMYLAAIMGIDTSVYEAAAIDGANVWQRIRKITIPMIMPTTIILLLLSVGGIFKGNFDLFYNLVGNNGLLYNKTDVIDTLTFRALISSQDFGMSAAIGLYQSVLCFVTIVIVNWLVSKYDKDYTLF